jgi:uncharacterized protein YdhG (YjbR/CyaY superfamily)
MMYYEDANLKQAIKSIRTKKIQKHFPEAMNCLSCIQFIYFILSSYQAQPPLYHK